MKKATSRRSAAHQQRFIVLGNAAADFYMQQSCDFPDGEHITVKHQISSYAV
jgi:hypothetical protein